jgi:hypothetical protein
MDGDEGLGGSLSSSGDNNHHHNNNNNHRHHHHRPAHDKNGGVTFAQLLKVVIN